MNTKIKYWYAEKEDFGTPGNGYSDEGDYIITDGNYDFGDYLEDRDVRYDFDEDRNTYYALDDEGNRTGEAWMIISEEPTDEDLYC